MLIRRAALLDGAVVDVRVADTVTEVGPNLTAGSGEEVLDARGGLVLPGLHDHHVHLLATAAALDSVRVGPPRSRAEFAAALRSAPADTDGWVRAVGYHDSVAGPLDRAVLDDLVPDRPVRVQHRSGAMWVLNSAALARVGLREHADGRLFRTDALANWPRRVPALGPLSAVLTSYGVTGLTEATPGQSRADIENLAAARRSGELRQRLHCMAPPEVEGVGGVTFGATKVILDDPTLDLDALTEWVRRCHDGGRAVAVHCVTDSQLVVALAAMRAAGPRRGDRIEHAAVVPPDLLGDLAELGVTVVTQPNLVAERGDEYLNDVPVTQQSDLWRVGTLLEAGVAVALSTDTPFGAADPWAAMRAAVRRQTPSGAILGGAERVSPRTAVTMFLGHASDPARPRAVAAGQPGDLVVLSAGPREVLNTLVAEMVSATIIGGELVR
ncbi:amidohydrolase family protein [Mycobacterium sp. ACS4331]|uniref:amidohydrolase family protein n=1 Tax=Mycobacterium sp. ACS4331 TaxID=1834121 RepID=UPI0007FC50EB|nr:amidohydrolase family protein [Mycobacterium sp. ACS4331]OBF29169.1 amidohydrolase [Mycobacterium sp. ACS4331]